MDIGSCVGCGDDTCGDKCELMSSLIDEVEGMEDEEVP